VKDPSYAGAARVGDEPSARRPDHSFAAKEIDCTRAVIGSPSGSVSFPSTPGALTLSRPPGPIVQSSGLATGGRLSGGVTVVVMLAELLAALGSCCLLATVTRLTAVPTVTARAVICPEPPPVAGIEPGLHVTVWPETEQNGGAETNWSSGGSVSVTMGSLAVSGPSLKTVTR
jgi:hypothetical protein